MQSTAMPPLSLHSPPPANRPNDNRLVLMPEYMIQIITSGGSFTETEKKLLASSRHTQQEFERLKRQYKPL